MTETILSQICTIRDSGITNMFDVVAVEREAFKRDFLDLVLYIEEDRVRYFNFILYGREEDSAPGIDACDTER